MVLRQQAGQQTVDGSAVDRTVSQRMVVGNGRGWQTRGNLNKGNTESKGGHKGKENRKNLEDAENIWKARAAT